MESTTFNPWLQIWVKPRATIARILSESPNRGFWILAIIYGFSSALNWFQTILMGQHLGLIHIFTLAIVISPLWGYVGFSVWSWVVMFTGQWLKGKGTFKEIRMAYAWSCFPLIVNVILWIAMAFLFGRTLFSNFTPESQMFTQGQVAVLFIILLLRITAAVWSIVIYLNALAQVRQYSILRAIGNVIIAAVIIAIVFYIVMVVSYSLLGTAFHNMRIL